MKIFTYFRGDKVIWAIVFLLSLFSLLSVYSATSTLAYKHQNGNAFYYMFKHLFILSLGFVIMYLIHTVRYTLFSRISQLALFLAVPLLAFTLLGPGINEASRWIAIPGTGLTFQTSDFAKLALIMYLARFLSQKQDNIKDFKSAFVPIMVPIGLICGLILPANFSTAAVLFVTSMVILFIGRINVKYILAIFASGIVVLGLFLAILSQMPNQGRLGTWKKRIENFRNPDSENNFQVDQAKIAIATGGMLGKGPGKSTQRNFLPHPYSDFIYAFIIEEYGTIAGVFVVFLYLVLLTRGMSILKHSDKTFGGLLAIGITFSLVFQALINMAVATNLFPVTGQPLPMVSMGGTSIWFTSIAIGIVLSVSRSVTETVTDNDD